MIGERHCPICHAPALAECVHLALAVEARDFVRRCIESCEARRQWQAAFQHRGGQSGRSGDWSPEQEDFKWLETAFCNEFLKQLRWFGGMDHEWRSGPRRGQGGFWVLLWSKDPQRLWWELRDEIERQATMPVQPRSVPSASRPLAL